MIIYNEHSRNKLKEGIDSLANAVKLTLGPNGRNVIIQTPEGPFITKDGVTVARNVFLHDIFENMGAQMIMQASINTNKQVGDGTTTATVLTQAILEEGFKLLDKGEDGQNIKKSIEKDLGHVIKQLDKRSKDIKNKDVYNVALVSTNGDEKLSTLIYDCYKQVGGNITFDISQTPETYFDIVKGLSFNTSYFSTYFVNSTENSVKYKDVQVFLYNGKFESVKEIMPILREATKPVVIFADDMDNNCIMTMVKNNKEGKKTSVGIKSPGFGYGRLSALKDISAYTGAKIYQKNQTLNNITFGQADQLIVEKYRTILLGGKGDQKDIDLRIKDLEFSKTEDAMDKTSQRISQFKNGMATIFVGASSELEMKEKKDRLEDALNAVRAAEKEGVVQGAGITLYDIAGTMDIDSILRRAIQVPRKQILANAGVRTKEEDVYGFHEDEYVNRRGTEEIIDPVLVTKTALKNACSVASTILTTGAAIGYE